MSTDLNQQLATLVSAGASLTLPDGLTVALADAVILNDRTLWYCEIWPRDDFAQHWLEFAGIEPGPGAQMTISRLDGTLAVIAPLDDYERTEWNWQAWTHDAGLRAFVAQLRKLVPATPKV